MAVTFGTERREADDGIDATAFAKFESMWSHVVKSGAWPQPIVKPEGVPGSTDGSFYLRKTPVSQGGLSSQRVKAEDEAIGDVHADAWHAPPFARLTEHGRVVLPLCMTFRYLWKGADNEQYPIQADLVYASDTCMLHRIRDNPMLPTRLSGKYFSALSSSALALKPCEINGYVAWYFQDADGTYHPMKEARTRRFKNVHKDEPEVQDMARHILKQDLLAMPDFTQVPHPSLTRRANVNANPHIKRRRPITQQPINEREAERQRLAWHMGNSALAVMNYLVEVFPGLSRNITVQILGTEQPIEQMLVHLPQEVQAILMPEPPFLMLGGVLLWLSRTGQGLDQFSIGTACTNLQQVLNSRTNPDRFCLSASDWCASFEPQLRMSFLGCRLSADTLTVHRHGTRDVLKHVQIMDMLAETAFVRHVDTNTAIQCAVKQTPECFLRLMALPLATPR